MSHQTYYSVSGAALGSGGAASSGTADAPLRSSYAGATSDQVWRPSLRASAEAAAAGRSAQVTVPERMKPTFGDHRAKGSMEDEIRLLHGLNAASEPLLKEPASWKGVPYKKGGAQGKTVGPASPAAAGPAVNPPPPRPRQLRRVVPTPPPPPKPQQQQSQHGGGTSVGASGGGTATPAQLMQSQPKVPRTSTGSEVVPIEGDQASWS